MFLRHFEYQRPKKCVNYCPYLSSQKMNFDFLLSKRKNLYPDKKPVILKMLPVLVVCTSLPMCIFIYVLFYMLL